MIQQYVELGVDVMVGCIEVFCEEVKGFGVMYVDDNDNIFDFVEKFVDLLVMLGYFDLVFVFMGIYVFEIEVLVQLLMEDVVDLNLLNDFGKDIILKVVRIGMVKVYLFFRFCIMMGLEKEFYWWDVGIIDVFWQVNIDFIDFMLKLDIYDIDWLIWIYLELMLLVKFIYNEEGWRGFVILFLVFGGCIIFGLIINWCFLFIGVCV